MGSTSVQSSAHGGLDDKDIPPGCVTFIGSGGCQQQSTCHTSFTKGWGITPVHTLAEKWESITSGAGRFVKDDEKGKKRASTCENSSYQICENWQETTWKQKFYNCNQSRLTK